MKNIEEQIKVMPYYINEEVEFISYKSITIEKWLIFIEEENEYKIIETSNIDSYDTTVYKRIKLLERYEVML